MVWRGKFNMSNVNTRKSEFKNFNLSNSSICFLGAFLLSVFILFIGFLKLEIWPMGDYTVLITDSLHQYLPFYTELQRKLVSGDSLLYSFSGGFGFNFLTTIAYYLASPLNLLMRFIPTENVCDFMDYLILFKLACCSGVFAWYLSKRGGNRLMTIAFGMAYGCSSFMIGYYFNIMWLDSLIMLPLIMYGLEKLIKGGNGLLYCLSLFYGIWCNYYIGFMLCIFSILYFIVIECSSDRKPLKRYLVDVVKFGFLSLVAGCMSSVLLFPVYLGLKETEAATKDAIPGSIVFFSSLKDILKSHMAMLEPINVTNTQAGQNIYCGVAVIPGVILYLFDSKKKKRERVARLMLCALLALSFTLNIMNYMWHGFHEQNGIPNRFAFLYIAVMLSMAYEAFIDIKEFAAWKIILSVVIPLAFLVYCFINEQNACLPYIVTLSLLLLYLPSFFIYKMGPRKLLVLLPGLIALEITVNAIFGMAMNGNVTRGFYIKDAASYNHMVDERDIDQSFYRSEIDRQHMRNVSMYAGATSIVMFNSTMQQSVIDFCREIGMEARMNKNGYYGVTKIMNDMFGVRYVASPARKAQQFYGMEMVAGYGPFDLYENNNALSLGYMVDPEVVYFDPKEQDNPFDVQNKLLRSAVGVYELFHLEDTIEAKDGEINKIEVPDGKQIYLYLPRQVEEITVDTPEYKRTVDTYNDFIYPLNRVGKNDEASFTVKLKENQDSVLCQIWYCDQEDYETAITLLSEHQLVVSKAEGNKIQGSIETDERGVLLTTVPYDKGWSIKVDGKDVDPVMVARTFIGINLTAGKHSIDMTYIPAGSMEGLLLSMVGLCLLIQYMIFALSRKFSRDTGFSSV